MITKEDILKEAIEKSYSLWATWDGSEWFSLGGRKTEYQSPKKLLAALKALPYPPDLSKFKEVIMVENIKQVKSTIIKF